MLSPIRNNTTHVTSDMVLAQIFHLICKMISRYTRMHASPQASAHGNGTPS